MMLALAGERSALYHLLAVKIASVADVVSDVANRREWQVLNLALATLRHFDQCRIAVLAEKSVTYNHHLPLNFQFRRLPVGHHQSRLATAAHLPNTFGIYLPCGRRLVGPQWVARPAT